MAISVQTRSRVNPRRGVVIVAAVAAAVVAIVGMWWVAPWTTARPVTLTGTASTNVSKTAIGFVADSRLQAVRHGLSEGQGFSVAGAGWEGPDGVGHQDGPVDCLRAGDFTRIELSYVKVPSGPGDGDGGPLHAVVDVRCLE